MWLLVIVYLLWQILSARKAHTCLRLLSEDYRQYDSQISQNSLYCALFLILAQSEAHEKQYDFKLVYEWKQIEYKFRSEQERSEAIENGTFNVGTIQPIDVQYTFNHHTGKERVFITTPRVDATGIPATLGIVTDDNRDGNPVIDPYPSWSWQINPEKCNDHRIVSVYRVWVDECDRLWVADYGVLGNNFSCAPQILAFDLKTDTLLYKYEIPLNNFKEVTSFITPAVEVEDPRHGCQHTWVYVANPDTPSLLVYSLEQNKSWIAQDKSFEVDSNYNNYTIGGDTFNVADGILTLALSPSEDGTECRKLRYHAMSNIKESWVYTKYLKNPDNFKVPNGSPQLFNTYKDKRDQQSVVEAIDRKGYVYFSLLIDVEFVKWDPRTPYTRDNFEIIANNKETMQFPTGVKITPNKHGRETLWLFCTAYQRRASGHLNPNETNFRIFVTDL